MNQQNKPLFYDYTSFGSGEGGLDQDASEARCRSCFEDLVDRLVEYERALEVTTRLEEDGIEIQNGDNTFIFNSQIDNGVIYAEESSEDAELLKVATFLSVYFPEQLKLQIAGAVLIVDYDPIDGRYWFDRTRQICVS